MNGNKRWLLASAATLGVMFATAAFAQPAAPKKPAPAEAAATDEGTEVESVVVTGTFLRGTPETATIPVESYTLEQMRNQGSPSSLDFVKGLSETGSVFGESNRAGQMGNGTQTINLRSLGSSRTLVVFNGRRMAEEYGFATGRSNNIATIPACAIGKVDILKDGGGTTYGADAVGGVVNYITRRATNGVEAQAQYRYIKDSKGGDYNGCLTAGKVFDKGNVQGSFGYIHRSELDVTDRDWAFQPYLRNPGAWSGVNNPGAVILATQNAAATLNSGLLVAALPPTTNLQWGVAGAVRDPACTALGGYAGWQSSGASANPNCYTPNGTFENLVETSDTFQVYMEGNYEFSDKLKLHGEFSYYWLDIPHIPLDVFTATVNSSPLARDKFGNTLGAIPAYQLVNAATAAFLVPSYNPAVADFVNNLKNANGTPALSPTDLAAWKNTAYTTTKYIALPTGSWRPFGVGGGAFDGPVDDQDNRSSQYRFTFEASGDIGKFLNGQWDWDLAITHGWGNYYLTAPDVLVDRLQSALNGYGGPNCAGPGTITNVAGVGATPANAPGANGCKYFNPFSSAVPTNAATGAVNPFYKDSLKNDRDLVEWMYTEIETRYPTDFDVIDLLLRSDFDYHLWSSENIGLAIGAQYRERHARVDASTIGDASINPCSTPGLLACQFLTGATVFNRQFTTSGTNQDFDRRYPTEAAFAELQVPITEKLNAQVSTRWEKYFSDLGAQDNAVVVSGGGLRYQMNDKVAFRATAQQSFTQANPLAPLPDVITVVTNVPGTYGGATGALYQTNNVANTEIKPERGFNYNIGGVFQIGSNVTATLDYYNTNIKSVVDPGGLTANTVINAVAMPGQTGASTLLNCNSPLVTDAGSVTHGRSFFQLPTGYTCVQGTTTVSDALLGVQTQDRITNPNTPPAKIGTPIVSYFGAQGQERRTFNGGSLDTSGIDAKVAWRVGDFLGGDLSLQADLTYYLTYDVGSFAIGGVPYSVAYDGVGFANNGGARPGGSRVNAWRGSGTFNYKYGKHNFNWTTRFASSLTNNDVGLINGSAFPSASQNANIGDSTGTGNLSCAQLQLFSPPVPDAAGTALYGPRNGTTIGYNPCENASMTNGNKIYATFAHSFTYRVQLPEQLDLSLTVDNVFDADPKFSRDGLNYDSGSSVSPLGRTFQISVRKTW